MSYLIKLYELYNESLNKLKEHCSEIIKYNWIIKNIEDNFENTDSIKKLFSFIKDDISNEKELFETIFLLSYYVNTSIASKKERCRLLKQINKESYLVYVEKKFNYINFEKLKYFLFNDLKRNDIEVLNNKNYWDDLLDKQININEFIEIERDIYFFKVKFILKNGNISKKTKYILEESIIKEKITDYLNKSPEKSEEERLLYFIKNIKRYSNKCDKNNFKVKYKRIKKITEITKKYI